MQKDVRKRNIKNTVTKNKKNKNNNCLKNILIIIIALIFIFFIIILGVYLYTNNKIYNLLSKTESGLVLEYGHFFKKLYLSEKVKNEIKNKNIKLMINYKGNIYVISPENVEKENDVYINYKKLNTSDIKEFQGSSAMYISNNNFLEMNIKLPNYLDTYSNVDVYKKNMDSTYEMYMACVSKDENSRIKIPKCNEEILGYAIVYTKLKDVEISSMIDGVLNLGKSINTTLEIKYIPENATEKNIKITSENEDLLKVEEGLNLCPISMGDTVLNIDNVEISKKINVHISNYVTAISTNVTNLTLNKGDKYTIEYSVIPDDAENKEIIFEVADPNIILTESNVITAQNLGSTTLTLKTTSGNIVETKVTVNVVEKKISNNNSDVGLTYINGILIANKTYSLPSTYNPGGLTKETQEAFNKMKQAAASEGISLWIASGFRSYATQARLYSNYVSGYGQEAADTFSARAGHSEHQTGLAMDVNYVEDWFGDTKEGKWLAENCHKYGFIVRYPKDKEHITGYKYEPWHIRYLGVEVATEVYNSLLCLEEYLNITSEYSN